MVYCMLMYTTTHLKLHDEVSEVELCLQIQSDANTLLSYDKQSKDIVYVKTWFNINQCFLIGAFR